MIDLPEEVKVYTTKHGTKIHLQLVCAGRAVDVKRIHETEFLERLRNGEGCKNCIPQPAMINFVEKHLEKKRKEQHPDHKED